MADPPSAQPPRRPWFATAWSVTALCFSLALLGHGVRDIFTVFVLPIHAEFGWERGVISGVASISIMTIGLGAPLVGWVFDKLGPRTLYLLGLATAGSGFLLASAMTTLWQFYLYIGGMIGLAGAALGVVAHSALLSRWHAERLGTALGIVQMALGIGTLVLLPLTQYLVDTIGWRGSYRVLGVGACGVIVPLLFVRWRTVEAGGGARAIAALAEGARAAWTLAAALRTRLFWAFFGTLFFTSFGMFALMLQLVPYLVEAGIPALQAAGIYGLCGVASTSGMLLFGWVGDRFGRSLSVLISFGCSTLGVILVGLIPHHPAYWLLILFAVVFGAGMGARGPVISALAAGIFRGPHFGRIIGMVNTAQGTGGALGAWLGGSLHDLTGDYSVLPWLSAIGLVLATLAFIPIPAFTRRALGGS
ncbi:MAG: MFS transporter [Alphaproteobacteria bacterium]|nr:MFS transporter [Alphaproteobacteria bacterium]